MSQNATLSIREESRIEYLTDSGVWTENHMKRFPTQQKARDELVREADWMSGNGRDFDPTRYRVTTRTVVTTSTEWKED